MIRTIVVDDQSLVRAGVRVVLESAPDIEVVGEAVDGFDAVRAVERLRPHVVLSDVRMPRVDGIEATRRIIAAAPGTQVLILTRCDDEETIYAALAAGAIGFLVRDGDPRLLADAVRRAARGEPVLGGPVLSRVVRRARRAFEAERSGARPGPESAGLTPRERDVLALVGAGFSNAEIAARLHLGVTTVKTHIVALLDKLGVRNRVQAGVFAHRLGLVDDGFNPVPPISSGPTR